MTTPLHTSLDNSYRALARRIVEANQLDQGHKAPYYFYSGAKLVVDLTYAPLLLSRKVPWKGLEAELSCWIDHGMHDPAVYLAQGLKFYEGVCKGEQWIPYGNWKDQFELAVKKLKSDPSSKKIMLELPSVWKDDMWYPGCVRSIQFFGHKQTLHSHVYIRSSDVALGLPCDIWQMGQLTRRTQVEVGFERAILNIYIANAHIYTDHLDGMQELAERPLNGLRYPEWQPKGYSLALPDSYRPHPAIPFTFHK